MSVEISGPKGYEYQYMGSLLITLQYLDEEDLEVYIEKPNEEDSQILFEKDNIKYTIDIQVKNKSEDIDISIFSKWLNHYENSSHNRMLLNKLEEDTNRFVVFVSNARCKDEVSNFLDDGRIENKLRKSINRELIKNIKRNIKLSYSARKSELEKKRDDFTNNYLNNITDTTLKSILERVKIKEKYTTDTIKHELSIILNKKYHVPQSMCTSVILELNEIIKEGRGTNKSIVKDISNLIEKYSSKTILFRDENYINRSEKTKGVNILDEKNILLITGVSLCGKTYLARDIGQDYLDKGYNVQIFSEITGESGALLYISNRSTEDRLAIIEDPFGSIKTKENAREIEIVLKKLLSLSTKNRKVIVTSRKDIVLDTMLKKSIKECSINSNEWIDLTCNSAVETEEIWNKLFKNIDNCDEIYKKINKWINYTEKTESLQLGQIAQIFNSNIDIEKSSIQEIIKEARKDSQDLADIIEKRGENAIKIFITLGITCNTFKSVRYNDLAFILDNNKECPGLSNKINNDISLSLSEKEDNVEFPSYNSVYEISKEYVNEIKYLRDYGYIQIDKFKRIHFIHPIYQYAAKLLLVKEFNDPFDSDDVIKIINKSIGSLSVNSAICTISVIKDIYNEENKNIIIKILLNSLSTIFPAVRDTAMMFLDKKINDLNKEQQDVIVNILKKNDVKNGGVLWNNGIPWFNPSSKRSLYGYFLGYGKECESILDLINNTNNEITPEDIWTLLNNVDESLLTFEILNKALTYDESFIREIAIRLIFKNYAFNFNKCQIIEYLNEYEHCNYVYGLFRGAIDSWANYKIEYRRLIIDYIKGLLNLTSVSLKFKILLENFENQYKSDGIYWERMEESQKKILWEAWNEIFIEYLNKFPTKYIEIHQPHMVRVTNESLKYVNSNINIVELATAWFHWLDKYLKYKFPDDYGMSVADYLMNGTKRNYANRKEIFKEMINVENTSFITTNVKVFIDNWDYLSNDEKQMIFNLIVSDRKDIKWIQAVILNRKDLCNEVQVRLLGKKISELKIEELVDILISKNLLEQCLNVYCGYPQPLWWNGYHHSNYKLWDNVIKEVLKRNIINKTFYIALKEFMDILYNDYNSKILNDYSIYNELLNDDKKRKLVFDQLLYMAVNQNQSNKKMWDLLLDKSTQEEKKIYFDKIVDDIELIENNQIVDDDLLELFDSEVIEAEIYSRLPNDKEIISRMRMHKSLICLSESFKNFYRFELGEAPKIKDFNRLVDSITQDIPQEFIELYKSKPPRLWSTNNYIKNGFKQFNINSNEMNQLFKNQEDNFRNKIKERQNKYNDNYELEDWN